MLGISNKQTHKQTKTVAKINNRELHTMSIKVITVSGMNKAI